MGRLMIYDATAQDWLYIDGVSMLRSVNAIASATIGEALAGTDYVYYWTGSTAYTFTLPTAVGNSSRYTLKNGSTVNQTVNTSSSQTIDGSSSVTIRPGDAYEFFSDNTNWRAI